MESFGHINSLEDFETSKSRQIKLNKKIQQTEENFQVNIFLDSNQFGRVRSSCKRM